MLALFHLVWSSGISWLVYSVFPEMHVHSEYMCLRLTQLSQKNSTTESHMMNTCLSSRFSHYAEW